MSTAADVPVVFISYSHDSRDHKQWVGELAAQLRHGGVDVILDQWDLSPGSDVTLFMEESITRAGRVVVICTPEYVRKANEGAGGVGYERMIITAELVQNLGSSKFIPVIRHGDGDTAALMPRFLGVRFFIDQRDGAAVKEELDKLLRELHKVPPSGKPPLGKNPFAVTPSGGETPPALATPVPIPPASTLDPLSTYRKSVELARQGDLVGWKLLAKNLRRDSLPQVEGWMKSYTPDGPPTVEEEGEKALLVALNFVAPLFAQALAGVESGRPELLNQQSLLDLLLDPPGWPEFGIDRLVRYPKSLAFVYQALHGMTCVHTGQLDNALALVESQVRKRHGDHYAALWHDPYVMGWVPALGENFLRGLEFIRKMPSHWPWLHEIFEDERAFTVALAAYYMALNVHELAWGLSQGQREAIASKDLRLEIPPLFFFTDKEAGDRPMRLLLSDRSQLQRIWTRFGLGDAQMKEAWPDWMKQTIGWMAKMQRFWLYDAPHQKLLESF